MPEKPPERRAPEKESGVEPLDQPSLTREKMQEMEEADKRGENPENVGIDQNPGSGKKRTKTAKTIRWRREQLAWEGPAERSRGGELGENSHDSAPGGGGSG